MALYYLRGSWKTSHMLDTARPVGNAADAGLTTPAIVAAAGRCTGAGDPASP